MNKHTPTPWGVNPYGEVCQYKGEFYGLRDRVEVTGFLLTEAPGNPEAAANAAHIVLCVNSHDALVKALTIARDQDDYCIRNGMSAMPANKRQVIDAVLAAAGAPQ